MSTNILRTLRFAGPSVLSSSPLLPNLGNRNRLGHSHRHQAIRYASFRKWYQSLWHPRPANQPPYEHITQIGDPVLRRTADAVPLDSLTSPEIRFLADRMVHVMRAHKCVGLAAPQIGTSLRMITIEFTPKVLANFEPDVQKARRMEVLPLHVIVNPTLTVTNFARVTHTESCASIKGFNAEVARYEAVDVSGFDVRGQPITVALSGWNARIAQHEIDHLNGVLYTDIMLPKTLASTCWQAVNARDGRVYIEFGPNK